jgi:hypothetical protein
MLALRSNGGNQLSIFSSVAGDVDGALMGGLKDITGGCRMSTTVDGKRVPIVPGTAPKSTAGSDSTGRTARSDSDA